MLKVAFHEKYETFSLLMTVNNSADLSTRVGKQSTAVKTPSKVEFTEDNTFCCTVFSGPIREIVLPALLDSYSKLILSDMKFVILHNQAAT